MPVPMLLKDPQMQFGATTFFAKEHKGDSCGSNGLPLTPNSIILTGRAQFLKTFNHPYLCQYLDIIRGKHERTIVVSQYCGKPLSSLIGKNDFTFDQITKLAFQVLTALDELHTKKIVHRNLSSVNVLLQENMNIKLFNYGLYYITGYGQLVSFPIVQIHYTAPEIYLDSPSNVNTNPKSDIWSLGIILIELCLNKQLWQSLKLGQIIRKVLSLVQCNGSIFERIAREHNALDAYKNIPENLKNLIESCLNIYPKNRPQCNELLQSEIFDDIRISNETKTTKIHEPFKIFTIKEIYHWWQLAGGDVYHELKKQCLIRSSPPILSLPSVVSIEGATLGQERSPATLYDPRVVEMPLEALYQRLAHIPLKCYYPLLHSNSKIIAEINPEPYDATGLPLVIREKDPEYQFYRIILFRRLLHGYPFTRNMILKEAKKDIPPLLRGEIWAALLDIKGNYLRDYVRLDKDTSTTTDRQIEVDIPRCHQYNELLSSSDGHLKLKRILKAWVYKHVNYVYWQGLDSLTAPFLYLNFNDEAKAFACLSAFIPKYLHKFFLKDNSMIIQEYLAKFSQLIAFHNPELANHLLDINFYPELFAIPWFLTVFSHVFPLYKILHLWDKLLLSDSSFPLHIGLSVLTQLRDRLLTSGFNECILLFSDLPEVDIEKCVVLSMDTFENTPKSITSREHENEQFHIKTEIDISGVTLNEISKERCPRISARDLVYYVQNWPEKIIIVDIRNPVHFNRCSVKNSINLPFTNITFGDSSLENVGQHTKLLSNSDNKIVAVIGNEDTDLELFPKFLLKCNVRKICVLHGGFSILRPNLPSVLISQSQI